MRRGSEYFREKRVDRLVTFASGLLQISPNTRKKPVRFHAKLWPVWERYRDNSNRVFDLAKSFPLAALTGIECGKAIVKANYDETNLLFPTGRDLTPVRIENIRLRCQWIEPEDNAKNASRRKMLMRNRTAVWFVLDRGNRKLTDGLDAMLGSLLVLSWTAFEALCQDLLEGSLRICPTLISTLGTRPGNRLLSPCEKATRGGKSYVVGEKITDRNRLDCTGLKRMRDSYWSTFHPGGGHIEQVLKSHKLDLLNAIRNVMVHNGGTIDDMFVSRTIGINHRLGGRGDCLKLDFQVVTDLSIAIQRQGFKLLAAVCDWIDGR
jgi:hypothetical protein